MATLTSTEDLKDYCLRRLGAPVINIEIDDVQAYERIDDAIEYFVERHFDGAEEVYYKHTVQRADVTNGYIAIPDDMISISNVLKVKDPTDTEVMFNLDWQYMNTFNKNAGQMQLADYYISQQHISLMNNLFSPEYSFEFNRAARRMRPNWTITDVGGSNLIEDGDDLTTANWTATNATAAKDVVTDPISTTTGQTVTSDGAGLFSIEQTYDSSAYISGTISAWVSLQQGTYTGDITVTIKDSAGTIVGTKVISPGTAWKGEFLTVLYTNDHLDDVTVVIEGTASGAGESFNVYNPWLYANAMIIMHGYSALNPANETAVYDDRWVKEYSTALIKRQWGSNIKKFDGVALPGGITMNGQQIFDEANEEISRLEEKFSLEYELPCDFFYG